jgi:hypothetical protein
VGCGGTVVSYGKNCAIMELIKTLFCLCFQKFCCKIGWGGMGRHSGQFGKNVQKMKLLKSIILSSFSTILWQNKLAGEHSGQFLKSLNNAHLNYFNN